MTFYNNSTMTVYMYIADNHAVWCFNLFKGFTVEWRLLRHFSEKRPPMKSPTFEDSRNNMRKRRPPHKMIYQCIYTLRIIGLLNGGVWTYVLNGFMGPQDNQFWGVRNFLGYLKYIYPESQRLLYKIVPKFLMMKIPYLKVTVFWWNTCFFNGLWDLQGLNI